MKIDLYISDLEMYDHIKALMTPYSIPTPDRYVSLHAACDGLLFENGDVKITAFHNNHIGQTEDGVWRSFSFRIDIGDKRIVHSGDIKNYSELDEAIGEHCDCLIAETGHHNPADVLAYAREKNINRLYFTHHGRVVLEKRAEIDKLVDAYPYTAKICDDGDIVEI